MRRFVFALLLLLGASQARAGESAQVLVVGNSLAYVNHLPALFNGLVDAQPDGLRWHADLVGAPGGGLAERWNDGVVAKEIVSGRWQAIVLQERGGTLACLASPQGREEAECAASLAAHKRFIDLAGKYNVRVIVLGTWGPDAIWQGKLSRGLHRVVNGTKAEALDVGPLVRDYGKGHGGQAMTTDAIGHPTIDASLLVAGALYRQLTGNAPQAVAFETKAPMLPPLAAITADKLLSQQPQLAGDGTATKVDVARLQPLVAAVAAMPAPLKNGR
jgi:hypothetical protein